MVGRDGWTGRWQRAGVRRLWPAALVTVLVLVWTLVAQAAGLVWSGQPAPTPETLYDVAYGSGQFVAVGSGGTILTSPTGAPGTWAAQSSGTGAVLNGAAYGTSGWVVVGHGSTVLTSPTGTAWTAQPAPVPGTILEDVIFAAGHYVVVGWNGTILTSPNGTTWTQQNSGTSATLYKVTRGGGQLVVVGAGGTILTSPNGTTWTAQSAPVSTSLYGVAYAGGRYVAVGAQGTVITSPDGVNWTAGSSGTTVDLLEVIHDGCQFVAVGDNGTLLTSPDGMAWTAGTSGVGGTARILGVATGGGVNVAVGSGGTVLTAQVGKCDDKGPDLTLAKEGPAQLTAGQPATYTLTVKNAGTSAMPAPITVTDTLPAGLTYVSATGSGWTCTAAPGPNPGETAVTCTYGAALPPGQALPPITLQVTVAPGAAGQVVTNCARVNGGKDSAATPGDVNPQNNAACVKGEVKPAPQEPCCLGFGFTAGRADGFATKDGPEPATPPPGKPAGNFDETAPNKVLWHRFTLPEGNCIREVHLTFPARPLGDIPTNDRVYLYSGSGNWVANFGSGSGNPGPNLLPNPWDASQYPSGQTFTLDLGNLPGGGSLLAALDATRILDVAVQDDTAVDYLSLKVTFCACQVGGGKGEVPGDGKGGAGGDKDARPQPSRQAEAGQPVAGPAAKPQGPAREVRFYVGREFREVDGVAEPIDVPPLVRDGRSYVPIRYLEPLGIEIAWDPEQRQATLRRQGVQVEMWVGRPTARVVTAAGVREVPIDPQNPAVQPFIEGGRVMVPLRFAVEALGLEVTVEPITVDGAQVQRLVIKTKSTPR